MLLKFLLIQFALFIRKNKFFSCKTVLSIVIYAKPKLCMQKLSKNFVGRIFGKIYVEIMKNNENQVV